MLNKIYYVKNSLTLTIWTIIYQTVRGVCFSAQHVKEEASSLLLKAYFNLKTNTLQRRLCCNLMY